MHFDLDKFFVYLSLSIFTWVMCIIFVCFLIVTYEHFVELFRKNLNNYLSKDS